MFEEKKGSQIKTILGVAAGKGGVGKSTITVNLARALKAQGFSVGILDADIYGPSIRKMLPEERLPQKRGEILIPAKAQGISTLSMAYFRSEESASVVRAPIANGIILSFLQKAEWGALDYLLIDFPPGTGDIQLTLAQNAHLNGALLCTTPQEVAQIDVKKAHALFKQVNIPVLGVVENMSYLLSPESGTPLYLFGKGGGEKLALATGSPFLGEIPLIPELSACCDSGEDAFEHPAIKEAFTALGEKLLRELKSEAQIALQRLGDHGLRIIWPDGFSKEVRFSDLQKECPCAGCVDEVSGQRVSDPTAVDENLTVLKVDPVGRYGLRFHFSKGCSNGIYGFEHLRMGV